MTPHPDLLRVLGEVRVLLAQPDNDFAWSSWKNADAALAEIDAAIARIDAGGRIPPGLVTLFAPTGRLQEVASSSGWDDAFLALADRFDAALE
ncbi:hypothetical protein AB0K21_28945 [Streptosporangium sp. NPDC049248]|uniref:hypothetical protein n=1 Tax=Streptosporangium sp. NPDC049248 TaxID=3155651 RepID=UPI00342009B4